MRIHISEQGKEYGFRIILGDQRGDYSAYTGPGNEYVRRRIITDKAVTVLHEGDTITIIQVLKKEQQPEHELLEAARTAAHALHNTLKDLDASSVNLVSNGVSRSQMLAFVEGLWLTNYSFNKYFTKQDPQTFSLDTTAVTCNEVTATDLDLLTVALEGTFFSRDLVNEPLSYLTATKLAEEMQEKSREAGYTIEVFNKKKIESLRMGGLLAVNKGSIDPPTFSILEWKPENAVNEKPYVIVGKGVVFDTGGLSLKPTSDSMDYMKCDMGGAAAVAGAMYTIAKTKLPVHVIGLVPATDNRPDGNAYVPGDVITMYDGSTVEVLNTDAEGRMILADALSYAKQYDPQLVIELSTLTGAAHAAVGKYAIVGMGNADRETMESLKSSGFNTFERIAEFPFWDDFSELLKSDIADQKNIGGKYAGAITAGKFLEKFTSYPFIHLDIAGPSFNKAQDNYRGKGGSGVGTRLLFDFFRTRTS
jgi:leucyl aminopeptidase